MPSVTNARLIQVDALRGFALLGILSVNIWAFADPYYASISSNPAYTRSLDHGVRLLVALLFETKFYLLFSFLFGYSFTLQMAAAERAEAAFVPRMLRRQLALLALGLAHGALLYYGEILSTYALLGLVLLAARNLSPARARRWAIRLVVVACSTWMILGVLQGLAGEASSATNGDASDKLAAFSGSAWQTLQFHSLHLWETLPALWLLQGPSALAMFLFGYAAGRQHWLASPPAWKLQRLLKVTAPVGLFGALIYALAAAYAPGGGLETFAFGLGQLTAPLLTATYCLLMLALFNTPGGARLCTLLAPLGKMALSNYLLQSAVLGLLFTGYGAGWINQIEPWLLLPIAGVIFIGQMWLSARWLRRHPYGPFEWLLRAVTLLAWPSWRRSE
ncbi:hypothetical protein H097_06086 [Pseudomonas sp. FH4]|jgi:uncharacterized protein|uniref:DUF418 domain-containing protein n=1 Tax=Pseudomonas TaxID=286 RepID=UPI0003DC68F8|nr:MULTISPECIES: DUF418 domain-containing protein [Pseudomonas]KAA6177024.1 DUF418 domain-containing protein [Pseudomonas marginalis]ETK20163.1 hypothetical protein H097_06086 [Pseudomonas sp. FH4]MBF8006146.1 DUF418 domain-containing protein [Pseudomonas brenneri]WJM92629.1 DUF418 domain-containing protein [Pseudomonas brenneri]CRM52501.1 putative membrane protein [Pseudomonas sp. 25 R 14]